MLITDPVTLTQAIRELAFMKTIQKKKIGLSLNLSLFSCSLSHSEFLRGLLSRGSPVPDVTR